MIDHAVKKILSYELTDFIFKIIHRVLGTELDHPPYALFFHADTFFRISPPKLCVDSSASYMSEIQLKTPS
jgi:hypothetical protein